MPELRQNLATKEWVVIGTDRALAPGSLKRAARPSGPERREDCPFCPGNESMTEAVEGVGAAGRGKVRVVRNKFPVLIPNAPKVEAKGRLYRRLPGEGVHEVIIDSPSHSKTLARLDKDQAKALIQMYRIRFDEHSKNFKVAMTTLFKNHGLEAGTTLEHPHTQIVGTGVVPLGVRVRMDEAQQHFDHNNECVFCRMIEEERSQGERVVVETKHFIAFVLFAALSPFHLWIVPRRHTAAFQDLSEEEADDLAAVLQTVLKKVELGLGDPAYNFVIQSVPQDRGVTEAFHWYLSLVVRAGQKAGFELGSGIFLNNVVPEEAAKFLNAVKL